MTKLSVFPVAELRQKPKILNKKTVCFLVKSDVILGADMNHVFFFFPLVFLRSSVSCVIPVASFKNLICGCSPDMYPVYTPIGPLAFPAVPSCWWRRGSDLAPTRLPLSACMNGARGSFTAAQMPAVYSCAMWNSSSVVSRMEQGVIWPKLFILPGKVLKIHAVRIEPFLQLRR